MTLSSVLIMTLSELSRLLRAKHNMASTWDVYAFERISPTHVKIEGGSPTGNEGGLSTWKNCLDTASFTLSFEEIAQAKATL